MDRRSTFSFPALKPEVVADHHEESDALTWVPPALRALKYRNFAVLWSGAMTSSTGTWMQTVAQSWLVFNMTGSSFWLGVDAFLATLPAMMFALISGVVADRIDRRKIMLASQVTQMTCAFTLMALVHYERVEVWHILILTFITGTAMSFGGPAYMSLLPTLVPRAHIPNAVALNSIQFNLARVIGPAVAGLVLVKFGPKVCFASNGFSFLAVIISIVLLQVDSKPTGVKGSIVHGLRQGLAFIQKYRVFTQICLVGFLTAFLGISTGTLLPVFAEDIFNSGAEVYARLVSCAGLGAVTGAVVVALTSHWQRRGQLLLAAQSTCGVFMIAFANSRVLWFSYGVLFLSALCLITAFSSLTGLLQLKLPDEVRGRIVSIYMLSFQAGMSLGGLSAGTLAHWTSPTLTLTCTGGLLLFCGLTALGSKAKISEV
ncbi:MAG: MFS transporter [Blastocatellia bacterium]|nr:MFS transporter [Blastocatellia bacterium]